MAGDTNVIPSVFTKFLLHLVTNYFIIQISSQGVTQEDKTVLMPKEVAEWRFYT